MTTVTVPAPPTIVAGAPSATRQRVATRVRAFATLARRRLSLSAHTPRELVVPVLPAILFATVIAPALAKTTGAVHGIDYMSFVAVGTLGLLLPISCMFAGIGVIVDRENGAQRDLLAAPVPRALMVVGNLAVALFVCSLQVVALVGAALLRGADFQFRATGVVWFVVAAAVFATAMYGVAETLASRIPKQEEYIGVVPLIAIVPWFFAGSLFPITSLPGWLGSISKGLPLTHTLALLRYGLVDGHAAGLRDIWGMSDPTTMAFLSLGVVVLFAVALTALSVRVFTRSAVR
jgi:ABC-2 type transport system permease protein